MSSETLVAPLGTTSTALVLADDLTEKQWEEIGERLGQMNRASGWWIGDWINYGVGAGYVSRERYDRAVELTGLARDTLRHYAYIARSWEIMDRDPSLSFRQHRLALSPANGVTPQLPPPFEILTERHRQVAYKAKERVERAVGTCNALVRADQVLKIEAAIAVATGEERKGWDAAFRDAIAALRKIRARLEVAHAPTQDL